MDTVATNEAVTNAPAATPPPSELKAFKEHVEIYEFLVEKVQKRTSELIMPAVRELKEIVQENAKEMRILRRNSYSAPPDFYAPRIVTTTNDNVLNDLILYLCYGFCIGSIIYVMYKRNLFA